MLQEKNNHLIFRLFYIGIITTLTLIPVLRLIYFLGTTGANNLSNDTAIYISVIDQILSGNYHWSNYFRDTFAVGHSNFFPMLGQIGASFLVDSNRYIIIFVAIGLALIRTALIFDCLSWSIKSSYKWLLLPTLAALVFSTSQLSNFEFDYVALEMGLYLLGFVLSIWALVRLPNGYLRISLIVIGGVIASWSRADGVIIWFVLFIGFLLLKKQRMVDYIILISATILSSWPYFYYILIKPNPDAEHLLISFFNFKFSLGAIALPFIDEPVSINNTGYFRGIIGLVLCAMGLIILICIRNKRLIVQSVPALLLILYSILNIWQVSIFRRDLAPWYTTPFMLFWIGLLGLAFTYFLNQSINPGGQITFKKITFALPPVWGLITVVVLGFFYLTSNITFSNKSFFLRAHSPASASCLRNFHNAPTYCEKTLFISGIDRYEWLSYLGEPLERHRLSVFAPKQQWALQGDFILETVRLRDAPGIPKTVWSKDLTSTAMPFSDYHHLNLFLHTPNFIEWTIQLPKDLDKADFHSAIAISKSAPYESIADGVIFEVSVRLKGNKSQILFRQMVDAVQRDWIPFIINLKQFAGQEITLRLGSNMIENNTHDWAMYRFPYIDLVLGKDEEKVENYLDQKISLQPSNTDLSTQLTRPTQADTTFDVTNPRFWKIKGMRFLQGDSKESSNWIIENDPGMEWAVPLNICLSDYSHLYFKIAAAPNIYPRTTQIFLQTDGFPGFQKEIWIPLLADGRIHEYTYDLKLLELRQGARLSSIRLDPVENGDGQSLVKIADFRLIRSDSLSYCTDLKTVKVDDTEMNLVK